MFPTPCNECRNHEESRISPWVNQNISGMLNWLAIPEALDESAETLTRNKDVDLARDRWSAKLTIMWLLVQELLVVVSGYSAHKFLLVLEKILIYPHFRCF